MKILVTGAGGGLGSALTRLANVENEVRGFRSQELDVADAGQVASALESTRPDVVINCGAFTHVDRCVAEYPAAYRVNGLGPLVLANACRVARVPLVQVSTNEVFNGSRKGGYEEWMSVDPCNPYGMSKAAGEFNVQSVLPEHYIVRTAWLMASTGRNFVQAILRKADAGEGLRVVSDEIGNPTLVEDLAKAILELVKTGQYGTYHFVNQGHCSRWEFANEILKLTGYSEIENLPILSTEFQRASKPPQNGALSNCNGMALGIRLRPWQEALGDLLDQLGRSRSRLLDMLPGSIR